MHLLFKVEKGSHDEVVRAKKVSLRNPIECLQQHSSPLDPMLEWEYVVAEECINEEHAGGKLPPLNVMARGCPSGQSMDNVTV